MVVHLAAANLAQAEPGRPQNEFARDAYSYLHFPMVAGIVLAALGLEATIAHVDEPLDAVTGFTLAGGLALYLLGHVAFGSRDRGAVNVSRLLGAAALLALLVRSGEVDALALAGLATGILAATIVFETFATPRTGNASGQPCARRGRINWRRAR